MYIYIYIQYTDDQYLLSSLNVIIKIFSLCEMFKLYYFSNISMLNNFFPFLAVCLLTPCSHTWRGGRRHQSSTVNFIVPLIVIYLLGKPKVIYLPVLLYLFILLPPHRMSMEYSFILLWVVLEFSWRLLCELEFNIMLWIGSNVDLCWDIK